MSIHRSDEIYFEQALFNWVTAEFPCEFRENVAKIYDAMVNKFRDDPVFWYKSNLWDLYDAVKDSLEDKYEHRTRS